MELLVSFRGKKVFMNKLREALLRNSKAKKEYLCRSTVTKEIL